MKLLYNNRGFIFRDEQEELLSLVGMTKKEFLGIMNIGFHSVNPIMTFPEAKKIVKWFEENDYLLENPSQYDKIESKKLSDFETDLSIKYNNGNPVSVLWFDKVSKFGSYEGKAGERFFLASQWENTFNQSK